MPIKQPSQYECDKMQIGDLIFVKNRDFLYKLYRKYFRKDKTKIKVRKDWREPCEYVEYYQEDCTLLFSWEIQCMQNLENQVPYMLSRSMDKPGFKSGLLKSLQIGLYNIQIVFPNDFTITIPTYNVDTAIRQNEYKLKQIQDDRIIKEHLKFHKYKGHHFKEQVLQRDIKQWIPSYCSICGNPIIFEFNSNNIIINNTCKCGIVKNIMKEMSYDELAGWYSSQANKDVMKIYEDFWFKER